MVKIFIGNLPREANADEIQALFSQYGAVTECAIIKNYAFVHMEDRKTATKAIRSLHLYKLHGTPINVEASHGKNQGPVKLHVANVEKGCDDELRALFEEYGTVTECTAIKNFAFVHMANSEEAMDAIKGLDNTDFQGKRIHVQISKSRPRGHQCMECLVPGNLFLHHRLHATHTNHTSVRFQQVKIISDKIVVSWCTLVRYTPSSGRSRFVCLWLLKEEF
ncbi:RNA-binding protein 4.3 isoform X3 [Paramormyrops kingsleyae]|uniref:RNA-binding protein 4.3 isoform X3 n=1 Tax=Paramormyrops kingsleyae TaxID=1676925 RepID=UPI000CD5DDD4|nr:RNA-binding protein 4B-like isoform X3 [Paramormyrops kingsleyae]